MKKHELQNEELDRIGRNLLEAGKIQDDELESIISAPHLLSGIKARISAEEKRSATESFGRKPAFSFFSWQKTAAAFAALLIGMLAMGGSYFYQIRGRQTISNQVAPIAGASQPRKTELKEIQKLPAVQTATGTDDAVDEPPAKVTNTLYHPTSKSEPSLKANFRKRSQLREPVYESDGEFYPLTFTGSSNEIAAGAQIVRVELPRSSLFSMGVDLPDDDRSGTVKADLLISADGVARGFRLVR